MNLFLFSKAQRLSTADDGRLSRLESAIPSNRNGGQVYSTSPVKIPSAMGILPTGQISPSTGVANTGNAAPFVMQGGFGFSATGTSITIYWDNTNGSKTLVIRRADGSNFTVSRGSIVISGLNPSTKYGFAPFNCLAQSDQLSFVVGDSGTPRFAISPSASQPFLISVTRTQRLTSNERITDGLIYYSTAAAGAVSTGGGSNGAGGNPYSGSSGSVKSYGL